MLSNTTIGPTTRNNMYDVDNDNDNDSSTTLGHGLLDEDSSHASSALLGLTPLKGRMSPEPFISPATHTLNILSQQDTNNLRYDFGQMKNDAAAVSSQQSPCSVDITLRPKNIPRSRKRLTSPLLPMDYCKGSSEPVSLRNTVDSNSEPSNVVQQLSVAEGKVLTPLNIYSKSNVVTIESRKDNSTVTAFQSILVANPSRESPPIPSPPSTTPIMTKLPLVDLVHVEEIERLNKLLVHTIVFSEPGPLGLTIQHVNLAGMELCRIKDISAESQGYGRAQQGDLFCSSSSSNHCKQWLTRSEMLELAMAGSRPLTVCLARMDEEDKIAPVNVITSNTDKAAAEYSRTIITKATLLEQASLITLVPTTSNRDCSTKLLKPSKTTCMRGVTENDMIVKKKSPPSRSFADQTKISVNKTNSKETKATFLNSGVAVNVPSTIPTTPVSTHDKQYCRPESSDEHPKCSYFCQGCTSKNETTKHHNLCHLHPTSDMTTREKRLQLLQCGTEMDCRACKFELEHGWSTNKRYSHSCSRSRKVVKTNHNSTNENQAQGIPFKSLITIPCCLGCKTASNDHDQRCPQHPAFETSGARDILETIHRGVQNRCENCRLEFNTGKMVTYPLHSTNCPRHSAFISGRQKRTRKMISRNCSGSRDQMLDAKSDKVNERIKSSKSSWTDMPTKLGCCSACHSTSTKRHHELCPQHPTFATSGAKIRFERIFRGMQAGCQVCQNEFEQGRRIGTTRHAIQCVRRLRKNVLDTETELKSAYEKNNTITMARPTREGNDSAIEKRKGRLSEKCTGDELFENVVNLSTNPSLTCVTKKISVLNKCANKGMTPLVNSGEDEIGMTRSAAVGLSIPEFNFPLNVGFEEADNVPISFISDTAPLKILQLDESIEIEKIIVPFCFACRAKSKIHNALCPKHPQFSTSGAPEKLELLRRGLNLGCQACIFHFNKGYPDKRCEHSDGCECKQGIKKDEGKVRIKKHIHSKVIKSLVTDSPQNEVFLSTSSGRKVKMSEKGKTAKIELSDTGSLASDNSSRKPTKGSQQMVSLLGPATAPSETNKARTTKKSFTSKARPSNVPVLCKKNEAGKTTREDSRTASEIPESNTTVKQRWIKATNPWGSYEYNNGDIVLALPIDGFTSHEVAFSGKRFTEKPFAHNSVYMETHVLPEDGVLLLQLARDRLSSTPWGFMFCSHEFGGACIVTCVDPLSPASNAYVHGSATKVALNVHDIILSVNGLDVGGMTELGLEVELEVSGPDILIAVSRYRFPSFDHQNAAAKEYASLKVFDEIQGDKKALGWHEFALIEESVSRTTSKLMPPSTPGEDTFIADLDDQTPSTKFGLTTFDEVSDDTLQCAGNDVVETNGTTKNLASMIVKENKLTCEIDPKEPSRKKQQKITCIKQSECLVVDTNKEVQVSQDPIHGLDTCRTYNSLYKFREGGPLDAATTRNDFESDTEYDDDDNPWSGCVCGIIHELPIPVFWIQCDQCDAWFNVWERCVGVSEEDASHLSRFHCWSCDPPDKLTDGNRGDQSVTDGTLPDITVGECENGIATKSNDFTRISLPKSHKNRKVECLRLPSPEISKKATRRVEVDQPVQAAGRT